MWLSEQAAGSRKNSGVEAGVGPVTVSGGSTAVLLAGENRNLSLLAPGGIRWQPEKDAQVMVLQTSDGERFILGAALTGTGELENGELCLSCGDTALRLCRDGIYLTGRLFLNGCELGGEEN